MIVFRKTPGDQKLVRLFTLSRGDFAHTAEDFMYARMWRFIILPGKLNEFIESVRALLPEARKERGFRGFVVLRSVFKDAKTRCIMIGLWQSRAHLRASDEDLFLPRALAHLITSSEGYPIIQEHEVLLSELVPEHDDRVIRC